MAGYSLGDILVRLKADTSDLERGLNRAGRSGSNFGRNFSRIAKRAAVGLAAVGTAAVAFGVSSVKSYQESENALAQLNAVLKSTKGAAGVTAKAATNLASSLQKVTKFSDEEVLSAENLLLTFTKIGKDIFPEATKMTLDMSQALGQDLKSSSIQLGKALQDPILGVTALRRVGVNFNAESKETIKRLVETGQSAKAQALIMKELKTEFGGAAEAAGKTFSGRLAILKNSFDEVKESIGSVIVTAITPFAQRLADFVNSDRFQAWIKELNKWLKENIPRAMNYLSTTVIPLLASAFRIIWPIVRTTLSWLAKLVTWMNNHKGIVLTFAAAIVAVKTALVISAAVKGAIKALTILRAWFVAGTLIAAMNPTIAGLVAISTAIGLIIAGIKWIQGQDRPTSKGPPKGAKAPQSISGKGKSSDPYQNIFTGNAEGSSNWRGGLTWVGERGRELVNIPRGSQILPNRMSEKLAGSVAGGGTVNINGPINIGNKADADYFFKRIDRNSKLESMGLSPI